MLLLHNNHSMHATCDLSAVESDSEFWEGGGESQPGLQGAERIDGSDEEIEKKRGRDGGMGALPACLTTAFSCGVPVVEGWEFPSVQARRKATEDIFSGPAKNARACWSHCDTTPRPHRCVNTSAERREQGLAFLPGGQGCLHQTPLIGLHVPTCSPTTIAGGGGGHKSRQPIVFCLGICGWCVARQLLSMATEVSGRHELDSWWRGG